MAVQDAHRRTLADTAEALTIAPAAVPNHDDHDHDDHEHEHDHDHPFEWSEAVGIGLVAIAAAAVWFQVWEPFPAVSVISGIGVSGPAIQPLRPLYALTLFPADLWTIVVN